MEQRIFKAENGLELIIKSRKSAVIFEVHEEQAKGLDFIFKFTDEGFKELLDYLETISNKSWANLEPKEATSMGAEYFEYYDKPLDNNGYLRLKLNELSIERPTEESVRIYQFNKRKMESFIHDYREIITNELQNA